MAYRVLFRRVAVYKQMTDEAAMKGEDKSYLARSLKSRLKLSDPDMNSLAVLALACQSELEPLLAQKKAVITGYLTQFPNNKIPVGTKVPPPPLAIAQIEAQENAIILKYRDRLFQTLLPTTSHNADILIRQTYGNPSMAGVPLSPITGGN